VAFKTRWNRPGVLVGWINLYWKTPSGLLKVVLSPCKTFERREVQDGPMLLPENG
jgi:hypothetical protein